MEEKNMEIIEGQIIEFEDGRQAYIVETFEYKNNSYLYIVNNEDLAPAFAELKEIDGETHIFKVKDEKLVNLFRAYMLDLYCGRIEE
jgi:hypothetical protein